MTLTTLAAAADATAPTIPTGLVASLAARTTVQLNWSPSTDIGGTGVAGYRVYRGGTLISGASPVTALSYQDPNLSYRTAYSYTVVSVDNANNASAASAAASITTDWELVFQDEFSRPDNSYNLNSTSWFNNGVPWGLRSTRAYFSEPGSCGSSPPAEAYVAAGNLTDTRITLDLVGSINASFTGVVFWHSSPTLRHLPSYRVHVNVLNENVYLSYYADDWSQSVWLASATIPSSAIGTLRVEAISATRNSKVYFDGVLKINYTETDTSRPNSGYAGMNADLPAWGDPAPSTTVDNFILEK